MEKSKENHRPAAEEKPRFVLKLSSSPSSSEKASEKKEKPSSSPAESNSSQSEKLLEQKDNSKGVSADKPSSASDEPEEGEIVDMSDKTEEDKKDDKADKVDKTDSAETGGNEQKKDEEVKEVEKALNEQTEKKLPDEKPASETFHNANAPTIEDQEHYTVSPPLEVLSSMKSKELSNVSDVVITHKQFGCIEFNCPVDLRGITLDHLFQFKDTEFFFNEQMNEDKVKRFRGIKAVISLYGIFPPDDISLEDFKSLLEGYEGHEYLNYDENSGVWTFSLKL